jgi:hypothetical protein
MVAPSVKGLNCPQCGAAIQLRTGELAQTVACSSCAAVLDAKDPNLRVLQEFKGKMRSTPLIPLGTRGTLKGAEYEAIGYQVRGVTVDHVDYFWREYLLWNPYKGFRYLVEYDGHWNDLVVIKKIPDEMTIGGLPAVVYLGDTFKHFQSGIAKTAFVLGEFPWEVRLGDRAATRDFVAPPHMLSEEKTDDETTWSLGTYVSPKYVWEAFKLPSNPPVPRGVYSDQPDPKSGDSGGLAKLFVIFAAIVIAMLVVRQVTARRELAFHEQYAVASRNSDSTAFVTPVFALRGRTSNVRLTIDTDLANNWTYFNLALINDQTGTAYDFGREVSYYYGSDSDGPWTEGSQLDRATIPRVPSGNYYLRVQPELGNDNPNSVNFAITVHRDVPSGFLFFGTLALLAIPPIFAAFRHQAFEQMRWRESDHAPSDDS